MNAERVERLRKALHEENLDAVVCVLPENVLLMSGHWPVSGWTFLVFPLEGTPTCIVPDSERREAVSELWEADCVPFVFGVLDAEDPFREVLRLLVAAKGKKRWKRVGYEACTEPIAPSWNAAEQGVPIGFAHSLFQEVFGAQSLVDITGLLSRQRAVKTDYELERLRIVNEIGTFGLDTFSEKTVPGTAGVELVAEVEKSIMVKGTGHKGTVRVRAFAQIATGADETFLAYRPMDVASTRSLVSGDIAMLELAVVADGFWTDRTRVRVAGEPTEQQVEAHGVVLRAQEAALGAIRDGVFAKEIDGAARSIIEEAGLKKEFLHHTGHGVGFRYHESIPFIAPGQTAKLETGMVVTVEPGVYSPDLGGIRLEDDAIVTQEGYEVLGSYDKGLSK